MAPAINCSPGGASLWTTSGRTGVVARDYWCGSTSAASASSDMEAQAILILSAAYLGCLPEH
jgi:hypothetical protein